MVRLVCAIDVGIRNVGFSAWEVKKGAGGEWERVGTPYVERSTFLVRKDGRLYEEYEEKRAEELVIGWVRDRWRRFFRRCKLVLVER